MKGLFNNTAISRPVLTSDPWTLGTVISEDAEDVNVAFRKNTADKLFCKFFFFFFLTIQNINR